VTPPQATRLISRQGVKMGRPSEIHVAVTTDGGEITAVRVGGSALLVAEGALTI
jgi:trans-2,3-dihydro-3-hydroxyanthranilate isomerase